MSVGARIDRIDLIRGVSILLVLFHHFTIAYRLDDTTLAAVVGRDSIRALARNGNYGVTMFFVVSGFLITSNARRRWGNLGRVDTRSFYGLRVARILPCLILLLLVVDALALSGLKLFQNGPPEGGATAPVPYWLSHLAALTSWMNVLVGRDGWFNYPLGVLWSLSVEEAFYLSFPLACLLLRTEARLLTFWGVFIVLGPMWRFTHQASEGEWLYSYFACFDGVSIGCCTALMAGRYDFRWITPAFCTAVTIGMAALYLARPIVETNVFGVSLVAAGTGLLLLPARPAQAKPARNLAGLLVGLRWLGRHSYELYLFHLLVLGGMRTVWPPRTVTGDVRMLLLAGFLAASALLAFIIALSYSEPLNRGLRRLLTTQTRSDATLVGRLGPS